MLTLSPDAASVAASADAVVLVVGIDQTVESEGHDRTQITLPGLQNQLIEAVVGNATGPVVVVIMAGGPLDVSVPKNLPGVHAMLWCGYPGQSGGQAIADVIFGTFPPGQSLLPTLIVSSSLFIVCLAHQLVACRTRCTLVTSSTKCPCLT